MHIGMQSPWFLKFYVKLLFKKLIQYNFQILSPEIGRNNDTVAVEKEIRRNGPYLVHGCRNGFPAFKVAHVGRPGKIISLDSTGPSFCILVEGNTVYCKTFSVLELLVQQRRCVRKPAGRWLQHVDFARRRWQKPETDVAANRVELLVEGQPRDVQPHRQ